MTAVKNSEEQKNGAPAAGAREDVESVQESLVMEVCEFYGRQYKDGDRSRPSIRATAEKFGISAMKVKKILVTGGLFQTQTSDEIQMLYARGFSVKQISALKNISVSNVNSYLPYEKVIYNLDVRNEGAVRTLEWRKKQADRVIGRPPLALTELFADAEREFADLYEKPLDIRFAVYGNDDGPVVYMHFLRHYGFEAALPGNMTLETYTSSIDGCSFMYGNDKGDDVDGLLIRDAAYNKRELIFRLLSQIYCRRYETENGFFYRENCDEGDDLDKKIMQTGYAVWSGYIVEKMVSRLTGRGGIDRADAEWAARDAVLTGSPSSVSWAVIGAGEEKSPFPGTEKIIKGHGDGIGITRGFIWKLGKTCLLEIQKAQIAELKKR